MNVLGNLKSFWRNHIAGEEPTPKAAAAAGLGVVGMGVGAYIGYQRSLVDEVVISVETYPETTIESVPLPNCNDPFCPQPQLAPPRSLPTGRMLERTVEHHTQPFPRTALQGAATGLAVGAVTGVVVAVLWDVATK